MTRKIAMMAFAVALAVGAGVYASNTEAKAACCCGEQCKCNPCKCGTKDGCKCGAECKCDGKCGDHCKRPVKK